MKRLLTGVFIILASALSATEALSSPAECEFIKDSDQRNYCRALSKSERSWCEFIKNADLRHRCRALVEKK